LLLCSLTDQLTRYSNVLCTRLKGVIAVKLLRATKTALLRLVPRADQFSGVLEKIPDAIPRLVYRASFHDLPYPLSEILSGKQRFSLLIQRRGRATSGTTRLRTFASSTIRTKGLCYLHHLVSRISGYVLRRATGPD